MYLLGRTQMIPAASYEEAIARIMKKGFDGVELDIYDVNFQARKEFFEEGFAEKIKECMKKNGVKAYSIGAHMDFTENEDKFRTVEKAIPIAAAAGTDTVIINGAVRREGEAFEKQWESLVGNCDEFLYMGGNEQSTHEYVSKLLGKETIDTMNESDSRGAQRTYGLNYQKLGKELMSVDELAVMPSSRCIVQVQGVRPFYSKKYDLTKHPQYKYTADANPKFAFDVKAYLQHRLKVKPEEEFEVYDLGEIKQHQAAA